MIIICNNIIGDRILFNGCKYDDKSWSLKAYCDLR